MFESKQGSSRGITPHFFNKMQIYIMKEGFIG